MNSFISRVGGKRLLRGQITDRFPTEGVERYVEVFGGAGWVLFHKPRHAAQEVFNDLDGELVNLFRVVKYHAGELARELDSLPVSREIYLDKRSLRTCTGLTDIQRAARYFYLVKTSFGSELHSFGGKFVDLPAAVDRFPAVQERLRRVLIEHKDCCELIRQHDKPGTLFYCDPPYYGTEKYYAEQFSVPDHIRLRDCLAGIQGRFVLSYNDCPFVRELYHGFPLEALTRPHNLKQGEVYHELLIRNYE